MTYFHLMHITLKTYERQRENRWIRGVMLRETFSKRTQALFRPTWRQA